MRGNRRGPSGRGPCATARQPPPITATGEEPTHQRRPSAAKKKTSSGKTSLVSLVSFLFYDFLFHSHPPHPAALTSPSPCLLLGRSVPLSLPPCRFLFWVCQGMSPTSSLQSLRLEQEQALRDTWQAGSPGFPVSPGTSAPLCCPRGILTWGATHNPQLTVCSVHCRFLKNTVVWTQARTGISTTHTTAHTNILFPQGWLNQQGGEP